MWPVGSREVTPTLYSALMRPHLETLHLTLHLVMLCFFSQAMGMQQQQPNSLHVPSKHSYVYIFQLQLFLSLNWKGRLQRSFLPPERRSAKFTFDLSWSVSGRTNIIFTQTSFLPLSFFIL